MDNCYYIYIYLDPRKRGYYEYGEYKFEYEPFYVGKGKNDRCKIEKGRNEDFIDIINEIKNSKHNSIVFKLYENLNEEESLEIERKLINEIGRIDLGTGTLINRTSGGQGTSGYKHSEKSKRFMSEKRKGRNNPFYGKHFTEEMKISKNKKTKKDYNEIIKEFNKINYVLLTDESEYKNCYTKLKYKCPQNHEGYITWSNFKQGKKQFCHHCHNKKGDNNNSSILIIQDVFQIKLLLKNKKYTNRLMADIFNISNTVISNIRTGKYWSHIKL